MRATIRNSPLPAARSPPSRLPAGTAAVLTARNGLPWLAIARLLPLQPVWTGACAARRSAWRCRHRGGAAAHRAARRSRCRTRGALPACGKRARENRTDGNAQALDRDADGARFRAAGVGEVALLRAVRVVGHRFVVLAEVGGRVPQVEDVSATAQRLHQGVAFEQRRRLRGARQRERGGE